MAKRTISAWRSYPLILAIRMQPLNGWKKLTKKRSPMMPNIKVATELRSLHGDPRLADFVHRVGLPPSAD